MSVAKRSSPPAICFHYCELRGVFSRLGARTGSTAAIKKPRQSGVLAVAASTHRRDATPLLVATATLVEGSETEDHERHQAKGNRAHRWYVFRHIIVNHRYFGESGSADHYGQDARSSRSDARQRQANGTCVANERIINGWYRNR